MRFYRSSIVGVGIMRGGDNYSARCRVAFGGRGDKAVEGTGSCKELLPGVE